MGNYIAQLAWSTWNDGNDLNCVIDLNLYPSVDCSLKNEGVKIEGGILFFSTRDVLLNLASQHICDEILTPHNQDNEFLYTQLHNIWRKDLHQDEDLSGRSLALAHNTGKLDFMHFACGAIPHTHSVFDIIHILEKTFPLISNINLDTLFQFSDASYNQLKRDMMGGRIYQVLGDWIVDHQGDADSIIKKYLEEPAEHSIPLFKSALWSIGQLYPDKAIKEVIKFSKSENIRISAPAIEVLGLFKYKFPAHQESYNAALRLVEEILDSKLDNQGSAATALTGLIATQPSNHSPLNRLVKNGSPEALYALSQFLFVHLKDFGTEQWFKELLLQCTNVPPSHKRIIDNLDWVLSSFLEKSDNVWLVIQFLENWLRLQETDKSTHVKIDDLFDNTARQIIIDNHLSFIFTKWMSNESSALNQAAFELLLSFEMSKGTSLIFDKNFLDTMDIKNINLLIYQTLGHVYQEDILHSLIWSLTTRDKLKTEMYAMVESVFTVHIGYDYPSKTYAFVTEKIKESRLKKVKELGKRILLSIDDYQSALDELPRLKEFSPRQSKIKAFAIAQQNAMDRASEKAQEKSIFHNLVTRIPLKAGRSTFSHTRGDYSEKMHLASYSTSMTLPRSEVIDPLGANRQRLFYRSKNKV